MLVHVFDTLMSAEPEPFLRFLRRAVSNKDVVAWRHGEVLCISNSDRSTKVEWPSGLLWQKLGSVHSKIAVPVLWKLNRYYDRFDGTNRVARDYLRTVVKGLRLEWAPFCLNQDNSELYTSYAFSGRAPRDIPKKVHFIVDNQSLQVILLPHRGLARILRRRLEEVSL